VDETVLRATLSLLAERGYDFSVDDVAARANVHKTTIYRRWDSKPALVVAAIQQLADREVLPPSTGDLLADLTGLAVQVARALRQPAGVNALRAAFSAAGAQPQLQQAAADFLAARYRLATELIAQAQQAGLLRPGLDPLLVWQAIVNPLHLNAVTGGSISDDTATALATLILDGARQPR
jgi:AcrR family transcriptional regulator